MAVGIFEKTLLGTLTGVPLDAKFAENHSLTATPANFSLENGAVVTDHIILNPQTIEVPFELNNLDDVDEVTNIGSSYGVRSAALYNILRKNLQGRSLYTVVTRHVLYTKMMIMDMSAAHTSPRTGTLVGVAKFQQVNQPTIQNVKVTTSQTAQDGTQFKASSKIPAGTQTLTDVDSTPNLLSQANDTWGV